jgi:hypothetical protein
MVLAAVVVSVLLATMPVIGQAPAAKAKKSAYTPPKLPWGDPDLQGLWPGTDLIEVPLQRDLKAGERVEVTEEEFAQRQAKAERTAANDKVEYVAKDSKVGINPPGYWLEHGRPQRIMGGPEPVRPLHLARRDGIDTSGDLQQRHPDRAGPWLRRDPLRDDP